jgi:6-phosphofructokinase 1
MNAAIRAVTRCALELGWEVFGVHRGYAGLLADEIEPLNSRAVAGIMQLGGTVLGSARSPEFELEDRRRRVLTQLDARGIEALVVIGGNGSQCGATALARLGFPIVGVASTIDNDLVGSEITIGVDTALNIAVEAIDRLKTTASSHQRAFLVEVMGRNCGYLALMAGLTGGAEVVVIPEAEMEPDQVALAFRKAYARGKTHAIGVVAEGARNNVAAMACHFAEHHDALGFDLRVTTLGHVQRGGAPGATDRLLGTRMGAAAVDCLANGEYGVLVGVVKGELASTPLTEVVGTSKRLDPSLLRLAETLSM